MKKRRELPLPVIAHIERNMQDIVVKNSRTDSSYTISFKDLRGFTVHFLTEFINGEEAYARRALLNVLNVYDLNGLVEACKKQGILLDIKV